MYRERKMNSSDSSKQIKQMVNFIMQESHEKVNEIRIKVRLWIFKVDINWIRCHKIIIIIIIIIVIISKATIIIIAIHKIYQNYNLLINISCIDYRLSTYNFIHWTCSHLSIIYPISSIKYFLLIFTVDRSWLQSREAEPRP